MSEIDDPKKFILLCERKIFEFDVGSLKRQQQEKQILKFAEIEEFLMLIFDIFDLS